MEGRRAIPIALPSFLVVPSCSFSVFSYLSDPELRDSLTRPNIVGQHRSEAGRGAATAVAQQQRRRERAHSHRRRRRLCSSRLRRRRAARARDMHWRGAAYSPLCPLQTLDDEEEKRALVCTELSSNESEHLSEFFFFASEYFIFGSSLRHSHYFLWKKKSFLLFVCISFIPRKSTMSGVAPKIARVGDKWRWVKPDVRERSLRERSGGPRREKQKRGTFCRRRHRHPSSFFSSFCRSMLHPSFSPRAQRAEGKHEVSRSGALRGR